MAIDEFTFAHFIDLLFLRLFCQVVGSEINERSASIPTQIAHYHLQRNSSGVQHLDCLQSIFELFPQDLNRQLNDFFTNFCSS